MKRVNNIVVFWVMGSLLCLSCINESIEKEEELISIGVSTFFRNQIETRTEYSGFDEGDNIISKTSRYERIDWTEEDKIRMICPQMSEEYVDYSVNNITSSGKFSYAEATPIDGEHMVWGSGDYYFYALYPAPGTKSNHNNNWVVSEEDSRIDLSSGGSATIYGVIPSTQDVVYLPATKELKPNMNYAYMYASLKTNQSESGPRVDLDFHPLVTTIQFSFLAMDDAVEGLSLNTISLSSSSTMLSGAFSASFTANVTNSFEVTTLDDASNIVTVIIPDNVKLSKTNPTIVNVLMLPVAQTDLTVELSFEGGITRKLALNLKDDNGGSKPLSIAACNKCFINNLVIPSEVWDYVLETEDPNDITYLGGVSTSGSVLSYRQKGSIKEQVSWEIEGYFNDELCTEPISALDWITEMTNTGVGSVSEPELVEISYQPAEIIVQEGLDIASAVNETIANSTFGQGSSVSNYYNLSNPTDKTSDLIIESANSYIVNGAGYYKIPLVMGNGIINGLINPRPSTYLGRSSDNGTLFYDYKEQPVSSPLLHKSNNVPDFLPGVPSSAFVVWEDENGLIEVADDNYNLPSGCITYSSQDDLYWLNFHVSIGSQGNAVIAVVDENDEVMWSWHIWVTSYQPSNEGSQDIQLFTNQSTSSNMIMPINLGWIYGGSATKNTYQGRKVYARVKQNRGSKRAVLTISQPEGEVIIAEGRNPYYQWGRKDALWPSDGTRSNTPAVCYGRYPTITNNTTQTSLGAVIRTPGVFYGTTGNWSNAGKALNLWNAENTDVLYSEDPVYKTIYDPCPAGYCLPPSGAFSGFTVSGKNVLNNSKQYNVSGSYDRGWVFKTGSSDSPVAFFPATGRRKYTPGTIEYVQTQGFYWTAIPNQDYTYDGDRAHYLLFYKTAICPNYSGNRSSGFSVRSARQVVY